MPDNTIEWGQGAVNNTNDWGKAKANATNNFGAVYDDSPSGDTNIAGGSPAPPALAQVNNVYSMQFDGVNDSINVGLIEPFNNAVSNFAISYWVKANFSTTQCHFDFRYNGANRGVALENNASTIFFYTGGNFATTWSTATSGLNNNEWNHIIINFDGSIATDADKCEFWINGVKKTNSVQSPGNSSTTAITGNGFLGSGFSFKLTGGLDEFSTFNTSLTGAEILSIYNATAVVDGVNKTADLSQLTTPPIAWYRM